MSYRYLYKSAFSGTFPRERKLKMVKQYREVRGESVKTRSKQPQRKEGNPELRPQCQWPALAIPQMLEELIQYLTPTLFTPLKYLWGNHEKLMRDRILNLLVMVAQERSLLL
jgi:hypothetical protein